MNDIDEATKRAMAANELLRMATKVPTIECSSSEGFGCCRPAIIQDLASPDGMLWYCELHAAEARQPDPCPCCLGDPDLVCDACGDHACWAGRFMCQRSATAGVLPRDQYRRIEAIEETPR